jgi:hypothetical protein
VELKERHGDMTLAQKLGDTIHYSVLLRKSCRLSRCSEEEVGEWLLKCAVERGAAHYEREFPADLPTDSQELTDEEVGVALCLGHHRYQLTYIRAAAQLLSSPYIDPAQLIRLAIQERVEPVLCHVAEVAFRYAPQLEPWAHVRRHLVSRLRPPHTVLPHWSRFVSQTGVTPSNGGPQIDWLCRREPVR